MVKKGDSHRERHQRAPLYEALIQHKEITPTSFHVPGHKMGASFDREALGYFSPILGLDMTEITGLDDLHQAEGVIAEAQELAAEAFGAEETKFLIGGSTVGNIALILALCQPGDKIIVQRNSHKSIFHGIALAHAEPVYVTPAIDLQTGLAACVRKEDLERILKEHPDSKAVFLTNPTYYGMGTDLGKIAELVHRFQIPLLIDEAHGAHYGFHPQLPQAAMEANADAAVQSTHKMGPSMTMTSMLHLKGDRIPRQRVARSLAMIQSSSPSYPLLASLDVARRHLVLEGQKEISQSLQVLQKIRSIINEISWLTLPVWDERSVFHTQDPYKLLLIVQEEVMTGFQLQQYLEENGIYVELAGSNHVLLVASMGTQMKDGDKLIQVLQAIDQYITPIAKMPQKQEVPVLSSHFLQEKILPLHQALQEETTTVSWEQAVGEISGEMVIPYPPGIPLLAPGERISKDLVHLMIELRENGCRFHGVQDGTYQTLQVLSQRNRKG